jgi:hypothetical protein
MRKRIALFIVSFVVALGAFLLYQALTGAGFLNVRKPVVNVGDTGQDDHPAPPTYEQRAPNGDLLYLLSAQKAAPRKDEGGNLLPGQYDLTEPRATYYTTDGNLLYIRADRGTVTINDHGTTGASSSAGASSGINDRFRGAHLSGHVVLTYGPRDSFTDTSMAIKAGQLQVQFEQDLDLNYAESLVTSPGRVHLRADQDKMRFDGENLTIAFTRTAKKQQIELLRVEPTSGKDNYMLIRDVGKNGFSLDNAAGKGTEGAAPVGPAPGATAGVTPQTAGVAAAPVGAAAAATEADAKSKVVPATTYKISFGKNVAATLGKSDLTCAQLYVFFQANAPAAGKPAAKPGDAVGPADTAPATAPGNVAPPPVAVAPVKQVAPEDLAITWTGPMEMRPSAPDDIQLTDRRDEAIEAVGTPERPVLVHNETQTARAGILKYRKSTQGVALEPGDVGPVVVTDADVVDPVHAIQRLTCEGIHFSSVDNRVHIDGPGHMEVPQSVLRHDARATGEPLMVVWENTLDLDLLKGAAKGTKENSGYTVRRALFAGRTSITNVDFHLDSDALDILLAAAASTGSGTGKDAKSTPVLEHLLATGNVHVKGANRTGAGIQDADDPDGINADRLELMTTMGANGHTPSRLLAEGNVTAWGYQAEQTTGAKAHQFSKNTLYTPRFDAQLAARARTGQKGPATSLGGVDVTSFVASDGVIVQIESKSSPTVYAKGKTLTAQVDHVNSASRAVLDGERLADGTEAFAEVSQGERGDNRITGLRIFLDEKNKAIDIPGKGTFNFVQEAQKPGQTAMPAQVTWTRSMHFDNKDLLAHFTGDIDAHLVGRTDQISKLTCNKTLDVQLTKDPAAGTGPTAVGKMHLAKVTATGNVTALGTKFDAAGKILSSIYLTKTEKLTYNEASKNLDIPGPGQLLLQDYGTDKPAKADKSDKSDSDSHGDTLFTWEGSLTYNGPSGLIAFSKNVYMNHHPLKPFKVMEEDPSKKPAAAVPGAAPPDQHLILTADSLIAKVSSSKGAAAEPTSASPLALGAGGQQKLDNILARGHAILSLGDEKLSAETLTYDKLTDIATAVGNDVDHPAEIFRPGQGIMTGDSIKWDLTKGKNAIEVTGGHGTMQQN